MGSEILRRCFCSSIRDRAESGRLQKSGAPIRRSISRMRSEWTWMLKRLLEGCELGEHGPEIPREFVLHKDLLSVSSISLRFQRARNFLGLVSFRGTSIMSIGLPRS